VACFVITNGANDLVACSNGSLFEKSEPAYYPITRLATNVFRKNGDTTGCGDNFAGGFIASLAKQLSEKERGSFNLREAIALAVASGGFATSYKGGTYTELVPGEKWQKVLEFYNDYLLQISKASS
jgi:sugar/nucleoside kinase (ribokinase family)